MRRLLLIALLCGCAGSLVDSASLAGTPGGPSNCSGQCASASAISAGASHTCAVVSGGEARCWGANGQGQLGRTGQSSSVPEKVETITGAVTKIAAGAAHTCAIAEGQVWCWGDNTYGQLGNGTSGAGTGSATPRVVATISGAQLLAAGNAHTCAGVATGELFCWGRNNVGQLGKGTSGDTPQTSPAPVSGVTNAVSIAAGSFHTCAATTSAVLCWGANDAGQVGNGHASASVLTPTPTSQPLTVSFVGLGANHSCAGANGGTLYCWGANASFQVDNSRQDQDQPRDVSSNFSSVSGGIGHTCGVRGTGVTCWGLNDMFQLGVPSAGSDPVDVVQLSSGIQAVAAGFKHTCAIQNGAVWCWGMNESGQLGQSSGGAPSATPLRVSGF